MPATCSGPPSNVRNLLILLNEIHFGPKMPNRQLAAFSSFLSNSFKRVSGKTSSKMDSDKEML